MMFIIAVIACEKDTTALAEGGEPPECIVKALPDSLPSDVPFTIDASQSYTRSDYPLDSMQIKVMNYPSYHVMYGELKTEFIVHRTGSITIWVQVYEQYRGWSDMKELKVYFYP